ncbi:MAG: hypothetical protein R3F48_13630 [Candidatus Zixiibacteriota bacterium]
MIDLEDVRSKIIVEIQKLFNNRETPLYGLSHAIAVENELLNSIESSKNIIKTEFNDETIFLLRSAALLHDIGYAEKNSKWNMDGFEHISIGVQIATDVLAKIQYFADHEKGLAQILGIIKRHDDTIYSYPSNGHNGYAYISDNYVDTSSDYFSMIRLIKQADGIVHASQGCIDEHINDWKEMGLPFCAPDSLPNSVWLWQFNILSNLRLLGKRVIVDTFSPLYRKTALMFYRRIESFIEGECTRHNIEYMPELMTIDESNINSITNNACIRIVRFCNFTKIKELLINVGLNGDFLMKPYKSDDIRLRRLRIEDVHPLAYYVLKENLDRQYELNAALFSNYGISIFDDCGLLYFRWNNGDIKIIAPPVVEWTNEIQNGKTNCIPELVDGLHRCSIAKEVGISSLNMIEISNPSFPLVPLPVKWSEVQVCTKVPAVKRQYRYNGISEFPQDLELNNVPTTDDDAKYYFYRDLSCLGSEGVRKSNEK